MLESLFYKVASLQASNTIKKRLLHRCFPVKFEKLLRAPFLQNIYERLPLWTDYSIIYWFIQFTTVHIFHFYNNFFFITQLITQWWSGFVRRSISLNEIFSFWKLKICFNEIFYESWKKQFNWNLILRYTLKLTLN